MRVTIVLWHILILFLISIFLCFQNSDLCACALSLLEADEGCASFAECNKTVNREQLDFELHFNAFMQEDRIL